MRGALGGKVRDADEMHAARAPHLREKHGAELAGADQADGHGPAGGLPFEQQGMKVHGIVSVVIARAGGRAVVANSSIDRDVELTG